MNTAAWLLYHFNIALPPRPQSYSGEADFICPQAFGRNTWTDKELPSVMAEIRHEIGGSLVVHQEEAIAKLEKRGFDPGSVNMALAEGCYQFAGILQDCGKDPWIIGQWEVIFALATTKAGWYGKNRRYIIGIWPPSSGEYLQTRGLLLAAKQMATARDLSRPIIVGHREHLARCAALAENIFGKDKIVVPSILFPSDDEPRFDPHSKQPQTCGERQWHRYEKLARFHHMLRLWTP